MTIYTKNRNSPQYPGQPEGINLESYVSTQRCRCEKETGITFGRFLTGRRTDAWSLWPNQAYYKHLKTLGRSSSRGIEEAVDEHHHQSPVQYDKPITYRL